MITSPSPNKNGPEKSNPIQQWLRWERTPPNITENPFYPTTAIIQNLGRSTTNEKPPRTSFVSLGTASHTETKSIIQSMVKPVSSKQMHRLRHSSSSFLLSYIGRSNLLKHVWALGKALSPFVTDCSENARKLPSLLCRINSRCQHARSEH